jgi:hypothetical protein
MICAAGYILANNCLLKPETISPEAITSVLSVSNAVAAVDKSP